MSKKNKDFEVLRAGKFVDANGNKVTISESDLAELSETFDPDLWKSPYVYGHPKDDDPAQGYPESFYVKGKKLFSKPGKLFADFKEALKEGKYSKISLSIFHRNSPANPTPGKLYVRHVGFLGAVPPAVSGLANVELSDKPTDHFEIELSYGDRVQNHIFRRIRDFIIEKFSLEEADKVIPDYEIQSIIESQAREDAKEDESHRNQFKEPNPNEDNQMTKEEIEKLQTDLAAANTKITTLEAENKQLKKDASEAAEKARIKDINDFCEQAIKDKHILPADKDHHVAIMTAMPTNEIEFGESKTNPLQMYKDNLTKKQVNLDLNEKSEQDEFSSPAERDDESRKIQAYADKHDISFSEAASQMEITV